MIRQRPFLTVTSPIEVRRWRAARMVAVIELQRARVREAVRVWARIGPCRGDVLALFIAPALPPPRPRS